MGSPCIVASDGAFTSTLFFEVVPLRSFLFDDLAVVVKECFLDTKVAIEGK